MSKERQPTQAKINKNIKEAKFFQKHVVEGKGMNQCAEEMDMSRNQLSLYKKGDNYRQMAIALVEDSTLGGLKGNITKLVTALDATKPHNKEHRNKDGSTTVEVIWVADQHTRIKAIQEINKIYGVHAPRKTDVRVAVSISSDADLFAEIDEAERTSKLVDSYVKEEGGFELASDPLGVGEGSFKSRKRALLQDASVPEQEQRQPELAVQDN